MNDNPYEPPSNPFESADVRYESRQVISSPVDIDPACDGVWRDGIYVIARHGVARFPAPCIVCGRETDCRPISCRVRRRPGVIQFLLPILGYLSDSVTIRPSVCAMHRRKETLSRMIGHAILLLVVAMILVPAILIISGMNVDEEIALISLLALPIGYVWMYYRIFRPRILWAEHIRKRDAWLDEVDESVLRRVPPLPTTPEA